MKYFLTPFAVLFALLLPMMGSNLAFAEQTKPLSGVVELFTSQGCSSCPPADQILGDYAKRDDVLALAWHVDYWNYLGWKDTFSHADFTQRQKHYARVFKASNIYTPQAVVNGRDHAVGSRKGAIEGLLTSGPTSGLSVSLKAEMSDDGLRITAGGNVAKIKSATLWAVYFEPNAKVKIERGENSGETVEYSNVVRAVEMVGMMSDGRLDVTLPLAAMRAKGEGEGASACAVLLQVPFNVTTSGESSLKPGSIVGAAKVGSLVR